MADNEKTSAVVDTLLSNISKAALLGSANVRISSPQVILISTSMGLDPIDPPVDLACT